LTAFTTDTCWMSCYSVRRQWAGIIMAYISKSIRRFQYVSKPNSMQ